MPFRSARPSGQAVAFYAPTNLSGDKQFMERMQVLANPGNNTDRNIPKVHEREQTNRKT
jgi:hypothetical protein